ncbi:uncharacterized protein LOC134466336 [Engraulis encrasicolus]|uniref:uncharacterized protein LOC134466336 n=1 Tax=Engraulis encrasicolus TaxID=184585 RepID=UPI002FD563B1
MDVSEKSSQVPVKAVDIGIGAENAIKELKKQSRATGELSVLQFRKDCMEGLVRIVRKIQEKSPLKYSTVRQMRCLNPARMYSSPDLCQTQMKGLVKQFLQDKRLDGGVSASDVILQQFAQLLSDVRRDPSFPAFKPMETRLDAFLHQHVSGRHPELWAFMQKLLVLSHGQATVERGFSINKEVETCNMQEDTLVAHRIVCDFVSSHGGVSKVPLTQELLSSVSSARSRYRNYLETERQKRESGAQSLKRKAAEDDLEQLKKRKRAVQEVADNLIHDADRLSEQAEGVQGTKMAELIAKSNAFRRSHKEKVSELKKLEDLIASKGDELRKM